MQMIQILTMAICRYINKKLAFWTYFNRVPKSDIALIDDWEVKLEKLLKQLIIRTLPV